MFAILKQRAHGLDDSEDSAVVGDSPLIFISAAEPSGDIHGAALIRATHELCPDARFVGVAGPEMADAGCERISDMSGHSAMLLGALRLVGRAAAMLKTSDLHLRRYPFDSAVIIDSPTLHLPLAGKAHAAAVHVERGDIRPSGLRCRDRVS